MCNGAAAGAGEAAEATEATETARVADELRAGAERLRLAGIQRPKREAFAMWAALAGTSPGAVWADSETPASGDLVQRFGEAVARRSAGEPLAYAVGLVGFRTLDLVVDRRVLIPRPETEGLVDRVLAWARGRWPAGAPWGSVLDLGTGSGCIALSLAVEGKFTRIVATDVSADALAVARLNAERTQPATWPEFRQGSLLEPLGGAQFDVIVSNPPYLTAAELERLDGSVRDFEPAIALHAGADGLDQTRAILRSAGDYLAAGGLLSLEIDCHRAALALSEARAAGWTGSRIEADLWGRERYLLATRERA